MVIFTRLCLQRRLAFILMDEFNPKLSCEKIMDFAFDSHPDCYTHPVSSICHLPFGDVYLIIDLIENHDKCSPRGLRQIRSVIHQCIFHLSIQRKDLFDLYTHRLSFGPIQNSTSTQSYFDELQTKLDEKITFWRQLSGIYNQ